MNKHKCECGEIIFFEDKNTFAIPNIKNGICIKCGTRYQLIDNEKLIKKGGK